MLHGIITRGTTPTLVLPIQANIDVSNLREFVFSCRQKNKTVLIKRQGEFDSSTISKNEITVQLSQADTVAFIPSIGVVDIQIKGTTNENEIIIIGEYRYRVKDGYDMPEIPQDSPDLLENYIKEVMNNYFNENEFVIK